MKYLNTVRRDSKNRYTPDYNLLQKPSFYCQLPVMIKAAFFDQSPEYLNKSSSSRKYVSKQPWNFDIKINYSVTLALDKKFE